ncbi:GatB/YqeY domain-containing protein [Gramella sp. AN32]|uniref:GatB/YqeY domain-containing protein n=1 Tax=Christiangramia antarctica TaxID=2058158 RepID=A0ABW5X2N8_9FLAO|nr:GatB/YqeY domain-containing protein [Gramella sp. AN32]MCM4157219.1 glutamyl-tRNA amidotransferase [Gramella sp. AN32]
MSLQDKIMVELKAAMKAKDSVKLEALRAVKSAILLANTETSGKDGLSEEEELKLLQKLVKQRKDSAQIYMEQNRKDLVEPELEQAEVIEAFLPEQMTEAEIEAKVDEAIAKTGASGMQDMGKVMGMVSSQLAGQADGKTISVIVKRKLSS